MIIQVLEAVHPRQRHHKVAACISHPIFYSAFLMPLSRSAEAALKKIVTSKGDEGYLLLTVPALQNLVHCYLQIVIHQLLWHTTQKVKSSYMTLEECFL